MRINPRNGLVVAAAVLCVGLSCSAANAAYSWGSYLGDGVSTVDFLNVVESTNSPGDPEPIYADPVFSPPVRVGNTLMFFPIEFASESSNGLADTTAAQLQITIVAPTNFSLQNIIIEEVGDYAMTGDGYAEVSVSGSLIVTDLSSGNGTFATPFEKRYVQGADASSGAWNIHAELLDADPDFGQYGVTLIRLQLDNILQTASSDGTTAYIEKKVISSPLSITVIPEPTTLSLLLVGGILAARRRRR